MLEIISYFVTEDSRGWTITLLSINKIYWTTERLDRQHFDEQLDYLRRVAPNAVREADRGSPT